MVNIVQLSTAGLSVLLLGAIGGSLVAQEPPERIETPALRATATTESVVIDGRLDEQVWQTAPVAGDFVQQAPLPGQPASERTEVRVLYDQQNLYVGMRMYDADPGEIAAQLGRRGATNLHSDWAYMIIDSYRDRRTAFGFAVNPSGVKRDAFHREDTQQDGSWEAVWEVATSVDSLGWTAEFRIPLSQLRFKSTDHAADMAWGINFRRDIARKNEVSYWAPIPPDAGRFVSLFGTLSNLRDLQSPRRLELRPYTSVRADWAPSDPENPFGMRGSPGAAVGLDVTYGVGSNLTVTAALNPDFGQVEVDPAVVNLTAFETFLPERRPLFLEGADIFQFPLNYGGAGPETLFYTRRIGRSPQSRPPADAVHADIPAATRVLGAAKLSGQIPGGWSIGALHAVTSRESARWMDESGNSHAIAVEPATNYTVARLSRDFREGHSSLGGIVTAVHRSLPSEVSFLPHRAITGGVDGRYRFGRGGWQASGWASGSYVEGSTTAISRLQTGPGRYFQRPDAAHLSIDPDDGSISGAAAGVSLDKTAGEWGGVATLSARSPGFEVNDIGFQQGADELSGIIAINRRSFRAGRRLQNWRLVGNTFADWTWGGERTGAGGTIFGSFETISGWGGHATFRQTISSLNVDATRGGPALFRAPQTTAQLGVNSDSRRPVSLRLTTTATAEATAPTQAASVSTTVTFRPMPRLQGSLGTTWATNQNGAQFVGFGNGADRDYLFGAINQTTVSLDTRLSMTFAPDLTLELFAQPFVSVGRYSEFRRVADARARSFDERFETFVMDQTIRTVGEVDGRPIYGVFDDGSSDEAAYSFADPGFHVRSLRGNAVLRWEYRPGSALFLVWQQNREGVLPGLSRMALGEEARAIFDVPGEHVLMLKATYWFGR
jgi:hypothetical protein